MTPAGSATARALRLALEGLARRLLGLRRRVVVEGVRYRERSPTPLQRALSPRGRGWKEYEVRFPAGRGMTIRVTPERRYADLMDLPDLRAIALAEASVRPGSRVLVLGCGTGAIPARFAGWVGPHGAIVAIDHDNESIRFARRRYPLPNASFERGGAELLSGEMDGSFDLVAVIETWLATRDDPGLVMREAWRVVGPAGRLVLTGENPDDRLEGLPGFGSSSVARFSPAASGPGLVVVTRSNPEKGRDRDAPP
jgi:SAM-dependent methyltransferase